MPPLRPTPPHARARFRALAAYAAGAAGILAADALPTLPATLWMLAAAGLTAGAALARGRAVPAALLAALFALAAGWFTARTLTPDPLGLAALAPPGDGVVLRVEAIVLDPPREAPPPQGVLGRFALSAPRRTFRAGVRALGEAGAATPARGEVSVWVAGDGGLPITPGDRIAITGAFSRPPAPLNPGQPDARRWAAQAGRAGSLALTDAALVRPLPHAGRAEALAGGARAAVWALRARADAALRRAVGDADPRTSALVRALVLGEEDPALNETTAAFSRLGVVHILSISGFHVSAMAVFAGVVLRAFGEHGRWQTALLAGPVAGYLLLVPAEAPVVRAGAMALVVVGAELLGRRYDGPTLLIWTSLAILAWRPLDLWSLGYQLSCGMTLALLWIGPRAADRVWGPRLIVPGLARRWSPGAALARWGRSAVAVGLMCWMLSAPAVWCRTGIISWAAVAAGVLLAPVFAALLPAAFGALALGLVFPPAAAAASLLVSTLASTALAVTAWIDALPGTSSYAPPLPGWAAVFATGLILRAWAGRPRPLAVAGALAGAAAVLAAGVGLRGALPWGTVVEMTTLAVGDGACHILRSGSGEGLLWDCGSLRAGVGVREIPGALRALGVWRVPTAVVSHGDYDHYAGLADLAPRIGLRRVLVVERLVARAVRSPSGPLSALLAELRARGVEVVTVAAGDVVPLGRVRLTFLSPPRGADWVVENDHSLVARVDVEGADPAAAAAVLLTGDVESGAIGLVTERWPGLHARVVEAPHHGSARPEAARWLERIGPEVVVQSTGPRRMTDRAAVVWSGVRGRSRWLTTAEVGAVTVRLDDQGRLEAGPAR